MVQLAIMVAFFCGLALGALIADSFGRLPTVRQLAEQDRRRFTRYQRRL